MYIYKNKKESFSRERNCKLTDSREIKGLLGLLYIAAEQKIKSMPPIFGKQMELYGNI